MEKITFHPDDDRPVDFFVLEQTVIGGKSYLLVTEEEEGDSEALCLVDNSAPADEEAVYSIVTDEEELRMLAQVFSTLLADDGVSVDPGE